MTKSKRRRIEQDLNCKFLYRLYRANKFDLGNGVELVIKGKTFIIVNVDGNVSNVISKDITDKLRKILWTKRCIVRASK